MPEVLLVDVDVDVLPEVPEVFAAPEAPVAPVVAPEVPEAPLLPVVAADAMAGTASARPALRMPAEITFLISIIHAFRCRDIGRFGPREEAPRTGQPTDEALAHR